MEYFEIKTPNIFKKFGFLEDKLDESPNPKNFLIELTSDLAKNILKNMDCNQVQPFIKINKMFFFYHPWLINFFGSATSLIEFLCKFRLTHYNHTT